MGRKAVIGAVLLVLAGGCQTTPAATSAAPEPSAAQPAPPPPNASHVPAGTVLVTTLNNKLSIREAKVGDAFTVAVQDPLVAANRETVIPAGAVITGLVTGIGSAGERAAIRLNFTRIAIGSASHPFTAAITTTNVPQESAGASEVATATAGEAANPAVGAVIGEGELRTALVGGALGAGAGTVISLGLGAEHMLPAGTRVTLQTVDRIDLRNR